MKICAIGNSHLAALKNGWADLRARYPGVEIVWFGAPARILRALGVEHDALVPGSEKLREMMRYTSGGLERITGDYDRYLVVGVRMSLKTLADSEYPEKTPLSVLHGTMAVRIVRQIHKISDRPISMLPQPYPSHETAEQAYEWTGSTAALKVLDRKYRAALEELGRKHDFTPLWQPAATMRDGPFTRTEFGLGGNRLLDREDSGRHDGYHMNARFGALYLASVLDSLVMA